MTHDRVIGLVWAHLISTFSLALIFLYFILKNVRPVFRWAHLRYALHLTLPGLPGALALFALNFFDRIYLGHQNRDLAGQYTFAYNLGMLVQMLTSGFFAAYMPRFYEHRNKNQTGQIQVFFARNFKLLLLAAAALILVSRPVAMLLGRQKEYWGGLYVIPIIVSGYLFMYLYQCFGLYIAYRRKYILLQSIVLILTGAANILLNIWILPRVGYDIRVAALNTLVPFMVQWLAMLFVARVLLKEETVNFKGIWLPFAIYLAFAAAWCFIGY